MDINAVGATWPSFSFNLGICCTKRPSLFILHGPLLSQLPARSDLFLPWPLFNRFTKSAKEFTSSNETHLLKILFLVDFFLLSYFFFFFFLVRITKATMSENIISVNTTWTANGDTPEYLMVRIRFLHLLPCTSDFRQTFSMLICFFFCFKLFLVFGTFFFVFSCLLSFISLLRFFLSWLERFLLLLPLLDRLHLPLFI